MKLRLGIVSIAVSITLGAVAVMWMHYAMVVAMLGVGFALVGTGLLCEATDPRRKPNPRTQRLELGEGDVLVFDHVGRDVRVESWPDGPRHYPRVGRGLRDG